MHSVRLCGFDDLAQTGSSIPGFPVPVIGGSRLSHLGDHPHCRALSLSRLRHTAKTQPRSPTLGFRVFQGELHSSTSPCRRPLASATSPSSGKSPADHNLAKNSFPSFALHYCRLLPVGVVLRLFRPRPHVSWRLISSSSLSGEVRE